MTTALSASAIGTSNPLRQTVRPRWWNDEQP
jgi:hypothetical protein